jgi:Mg-chelatase subunit ChlD
VTGTDPQGFALEFVIRMRRQKNLSHIPSLRTSIAIPRFLTARCLRQGGLTPKDYIDAAVLLSPYEDQKIAWEVAREVLFPKEEAPGRSPEALEVKAAPGGQAPQAVDATRSILDGLDDLGIDLDSLSALDDIDALLAEAEDSQLKELSAFDLQEQMLTSQSVLERAVGGLVSRYGGAGEMQAAGIRSVQGALDLVRERLRGRIGALEGEEVATACEAGLGELLLREVAHPWELAGALAGMRDFERLRDHVQEIMASGTATDIGRTLRFLDPHAGALTGTELVALREIGLARVRDLSEHIELLDGLQRWLAPPDELLRRSALENPVRALEATRWLLGRFGENLQPRILDHWADNLLQVEGRGPTLDELLQVPVDCARWEGLLREGWRDWLRAGDQALLRSGGGPSAALVEGEDLVGDPLLPAALAEVLVDEAAMQKAALGAAPAPAAPPSAPSVADWLHVAGRLVQTGLKVAIELTGELVVEAMQRVQLAEAFLPTLDALLDRGLYPSDPPAVVAAGVRLGLPDQVILERLGKPIEQLRALIGEGVLEPDRYRRLVEKISALPPELLQLLCRQCVDAQNFCGMAALLAIDMAGAAALVPADFACASLGHKGIGGGTNLLKQWFEGRGGLSDELRQRIKLIARSALMELAFDWIARGSGTTSMGMVPQSQNRPFRAGDEMEQIDLEQTLEALISTGRTLEQITEEDLFVPSTSKGRAAMGVLLDISGSMGGRELANCAISVVMLLGRLAPEEIAIALFESNTHVVKGFNEERDLDAVADRLLELEATGGTRVDAALDWLAGQFEEVPEAEFRLMFLLSDFCFFERVSELERRAFLLADGDVRFIGAAHGHFQKDTAEVFKSILGGQIIKLQNLDAVPGLLSDAITRAGSW